MKVKGIIWFGRAYRTAWFEGDDDSAYYFNKNSNKWVRLSRSAHPELVMSRNDTRWFRAEILIDEPNLCQRVGKWFKATLTLNKGKS